MRIALVSDAWAPQVNGVVRTLGETVKRLRALGHEVDTITPDGFPTIPCPSYPEIRLAVTPGGRVRRRLDAAEPDAVHLATEGPLGWAARRWCLERGAAFTTSFHTRFADYMAVRTGLPPKLFWSGLRLFHTPSSRVFVATETLERELRGRGLHRLHRWSRGADLDLFRPDGPALPELAALPRPMLLSVGRVAPEKSLDDFLGVDIPGTKVVVGDGPSLPTLRQRFPDTVFLGPLHGERLASAYRSADAFVFPSRTDTFGLVMVEALASGVPVAAFPVPGPVDVVGDDPAAGALDEDLGRAIRRALTLDRAACAAAGRRFGWERCTGQFLAGLHPAPRAVAA